MNEKKIIKNIFFYLGGIFVVELLSYFALSNSILNSIIFLVLVLVCLALSLYRLEYGLLFVLGELFIGSMGHLFVLPLGGTTLSIRMALWAVVMVVFIFKFAIQLIKNKKESTYFKTFKDFPLAKYFLILGLFVIIGLVNAYFRGHSLGLIFNDFNAWLYWLLLLPAVVIFSKKDERAFINLKTVFLAGAIWLSLETFFLLFVFTHGLNISPDIYLWLRKTIVGEMTPTLSGWPRIFIQGQIYSAIALFFCFWSSLTKPKNIYNILLAAFFVSAILISFSRSFWVALAVTVLFSLILVIRFYSWRKALSSGIWLALSLVIGFAMIYLVAIFPYPSPGKFNADFISRVSNGSEAALTSRWSLLPVLAREIKKEPFLGQGYGATITYISNDPRVRENNPTGEYTTYAFEWGYLDLWLKIGLFGLLSYLILLIYLIKEALKYGKKNNSYLLIGLASGIVFLAVTNIFTPYLNHPLGIGILLLGSCLIQKESVY